MDGQTEQTEDIKNRSETGQTNRTDKSSRMSKTHQDYWRPRLKRRSYRDRDGKVTEVPEWQVRMFHLNREAWFNLETANRRQPRRPETSTSS